MKEVRALLYVYITVRCEDDLDVEEIINDMDYSFTSNTKGAVIVEKETEIDDFDWAPPGGGA